MDFYINATDSDLSNRAYELLVTEITVNNTSLNEACDYNKFLQDQQQVDDLKSKIHHLPAPATLFSYPDPTFNMEIVESGPNQIMYVHKNIVHTITRIVEQFDVNSNIISITSQPPLSTDMLLLYTKISLLNEKKKKKEERGQANCAK